MTSRDKILNVVDKDNVSEFEKAMREKLQEISIKVSAAIYPINQFDMPFALCVLEQYANAIKNDFPGSEKVSNALKGLLTETIKEEFW